MNSQLYDDAYVKLVKPIWRQNWTKQQRRLAREKQIRKVIVTSVAIIFVLLLASVIATLEFWRNTYTSEPNKVIAKFGDNGYIVHLVQRELAEQGYSIVVDGKFGPQTQQAIASWQESNRLPVTRVIDVMTLDSLDIDFDL